MMKSSPVSTSLIADGTGDASRSVSHIETASGLDPAAGVGSVRGGDGAHPPVWPGGIPQVDGIDSPAGTGGRPAARGNVGADLDLGGGVFSTAGAGQPPSPGATGDASALPPSPGRRNGRKPEMAVSMGLNDVEYYGSDRRGVSKLKGVFQIKQRNQRLLEARTLFQSSQEPDAIISILSHILHGMGAEVQLKKETRRKLRCTLRLAAGVLHAGIELSVGENGFTTVAFKRSRQDRGKTDKTDMIAFTSFFHLVHTHYVSEVQARGPRGQSRLPQSQPQSQALPVQRRSQPANQQPAVDMYPLQSSLAGDLEMSGRGGRADPFSRVPVSVRRGMEGNSRAPRAVSDMSSVR